MLTSDCLSRLVTIQEEAESSASVEVTPVASDTLSVDYLTFHLNRLDSAFPVAEIAEHPRQDFLMPEKLQYGVGEINKTEGSDELLCAIAHDTFCLRSYINLADPYVGLVLPTCNRTHHVSSTEI